jgi:DNA polymerase
MFIGEQPGDREDLSGEPSVARGGHLRCGAGRGGIARKKRLHQNPAAGKITACRFCPDLELRFVRRRAVVALGATALERARFESDLAAVREQARTVGAA